MTYLKQYKAYNVCYGIKLKLHICAFVQNVLQYFDASIPRKARPENCHIGGQNMKKLYGVYNIPTYTYVYLFVWMSYLISHCAVMAHSQLKVNYT
jgi:hypothetical protein